MLTNIETRRHAKVSATATGEGFKGKTRDVYVFANESSQVVHVQLQTVDLTS
jgi:hypothetical protein